VTRARAAVLRAYGTTPQIEDVDLDEPRPGEVLVRMAGTGICHTDLSVIDGVLPLPLPCVLGHEGAGVVERVGSEVDLVVGDHVVLSFDSCGACPNCARSRPAYCERFVAHNSSGHRPDGTTTMGEVHGSFLGQSSFATHALASARNAVRVPQDRPIERLGPLGCGVLTGAGAVLNVLRPEPGARIAVFGLGTVGLAGVMAARRAGCEVIGIDPSDERRAIAEDLGATTAPPGDRIRGMDLALETVGTEAVVHAALKSLRSPGTCATVGFHGPRHPITVDQGHLLYGRTLTGVIEGDADPQDFIPQLLDLPFDQLITTYAFDDLETALNAARSGAAIKPVLTFG
jgi:aryl-alcohol dehydrogenase